MSVITQRSTETHDSLARFGRGATIGGGVVLLACLLGATFGPGAFFEAYLFAYVFWLGVALGCLALVMTHHLVGGVWGFMLRRIFEAGALTVPLLALLFVPLLFGLSHLYSWTSADALAASEVLRHKRPYLNIPFFIARAVAYFAIWSALAWYLNAWSRAHDRTGDPALLARLKRLSAGGLILYVITTFFAGIDWLVSLEPEWYSTVFGFLTITSQALIAFAFAILAVILLARRPPFAAVLTTPRLNDLGGLLLTATMLWAYMAFSQFLIIWAGNLPTDNRWYVHRTTGGWRWLTLALILLHFVLPFIVLLFRGVRSGRRPLAAVAALLLAMQLVYQFWIVAPALHTAGIAFGPLDLLTPLGIGGIWLGAFLWLLRRGPLLPLHTPQLGTGGDDA